MKWTKRLGLELIAIFTMIAVVSLLAVFQYRWTDEISRNEQARLKSSLETSVLNFNQEFSYDFQRLCEGFEIDPESELPSVEYRVSHQYFQYGVKTIPNRSLWPWGTFGSWVLRVWNLSAKATSDFTIRTGRPNWGHSVTSSLNKKGLRSLVIDDRDAFYYPLDVFCGGSCSPSVRSSRRVSAEPNGVRPIGYVVVALNMEVLEQQYLVDLVNRHFGAPGQKSFVVSIRLSKPPFQPIYSSDTNFQAAAATPDATASTPLFDQVGGGGSEAQRAPSVAVGTMRDGQWQINRPTSRQGSLEGYAVAECRDVRNLVISFGLLAVLAASMALIFSVARRAKALAKLQMEFVAGVSHELCTPLAVINSAAENLVDGVVDNSEQMREYGGLNRGQGAWQARGNAWWMKFSYSQPDGLVCPATIWRRSKLLR